jgi:hypothetical protein
MWRRFATVLVQTLSGVWHAVVEAHPIEFD